jgi:hypothetical protein
LDTSHCSVYYGKIWNALQHQLMMVGGVEQKKSVASKPQKIKALNICLGTKCQNRPGPINFSSHANKLTGVTGFSSEADLEFADAGGEKKKASLALAILHPGGIMVSLARSRKTKSHLTQGVWLYQRHTFQPLQAALKRHRPVNAASNRYWLLPWVRWRSMTKNLTLCSAAY